MTGWRACTPVQWRALRAGAGHGAEEAVAARVAAILAALRAGGSDALLRLEAGLRLDPAAELSAALQQDPAQEIELAVGGAADRVAPELAAALRAARRRLRQFLAPGLPRAQVHVDAAGNRTELAVVALDRVGIYVPGGRAPYVSSVLMAAVPARAAGVREIVLCTPAADPGILAAAEIAGVDRVFVLGAVQALAAMAWGLAPVPRCDKLVGPGGAHVVAAKRLLYGEVGLDGLPGPSEIVVLAAADADPAWVAADLLAQAEHGPDSLSLLITTEPALAAAVGAEVARQAAALPAHRRADALAALAASAGPVLVPSAEAGLELAEEIAPEHLSLQGAAAEALLPRVRRAGAVFVGRWSPVAAGDYAAGTDHILPTAGRARFASGLHTADFVRRMQVFRGSAEGAALWAPPAEALAAAEGFAAHGASLRLRGAAAQAGTAPQSPAPYVPPVPAGALRLDLNENPFPWPEELWAEVLGGLRAAEPTRYPRQTEALQAALAAGAGLPAEWCLPGNGSDELLLAVVTAWGRHAARALFPTPTFGMYRRLALAAGLPAIGVPLGEAPGFDLPVEAMRRELRRGGDTLLLLCRPNNPTGTLWPAEQVRALVDTEGVWAVVDEAYVEFAGEDLRGWLADRPRLCLLRTMSKAFALAGLRVGYALGCPEALAELRPAVQPWAISAFDCTAALAALRRRPAMQATVAILIAERERLARGLAEVPGITPYPSRANYILFGVEGADGFGVYDRLYAAGAVLRRWKDEPALRRCLRVSVGRPEENDRFLELLGRAVREERATGG